MNSMMIGGRMMWAVESVRLLGMIVLLLATATLIQYHLSG